MRRPPFRAAADGEVLGGGVVAELSGSRRRRTSRRRRFVFSRTWLLCARLRRYSLPPRRLGRGEPAALLEPPGVFGVPDGGFAEGEAAVAGHEEALGAVALEPLSASDEDGDAGAVL